MSGSSNPFRKPPSAADFVSQGVPSPGEQGREATAVIATDPPEIESETDPDTDIQVKVVRLPPTKVTIAKTKEPIGKAAQTYRHSIDNCEFLRHAARLLKVSIGDLLDEAIDAKKDEWRKRVPRIVRL